MLGIIFCCFYCFVVFSEFCCIDLGWFMYFFQYAPDLATNSAAIWLHCAPKFNTKE